MTRTTWIAGLANCAIQLSVCFGCSGNDRFALEILGGPDCVGAEVFVDSESKGTLGEEEAGVARLNLGLPTGKHVVEFRRTGFTSASHTIDVPDGTSEHYLPCALKPTSGKD